MAQNSGMTDQAQKLTALDALEFIEVAELVKISWPAPEGDVYYSSTLDPYLFRGITIDPNLIEARLPGRTFQDILNDTTIADDRVSLKLWDGDGHISDLAYANGPGQRVEIFLWFPQTGLLLSQWWGHLQPLEQGSVGWFEVSAQVGFLSSMLPMPRRGFFTSCSALFGAWLNSQDEIDHGDCPYNRHLEFGGPGGGDPFVAFDPADAANVDTSSGGIIKNAGGSSVWNAGARHSVAINEGEDAAIEVTRGAHYAAVGFSTNPIVRSFVDFLVALQWNYDGTLTIQYNQGGAQVWPAAHSAIGDSVRLELRAGRFRLYSQGVEILPGSFTAPAPAYPLYMAVAVQVIGAGVTIANVKIGNLGASAGGAIGNLDATGQPFTDCPRTRPACRERLGDELSYLGFDTVIQSYTVNQTKGPNITVTTRGNESNLKRPLRVIFGQRHVQDLDLLAYTVEPDTKHPEGGAVACLFAICEGPIGGQSGQKVNGTPIGYEHLNVRNGELRQSRTGFSASVSNYSGTALFFGRAQGDFTKTTADQLRGEVDVRGLRDVRRYVSADSFVEEYTTNRAWCLLRCLTDKRWGYGLDVARLVIDDWINLAAWSVETVAFTDADGTQYNGPRTALNAELIDRSTQQQISDICSAGRFCLPYPDEGKLRIKPLGRARELFSPANVIDPAFNGCLARTPSTPEFATWEAALLTARETSSAAAVAEASTLITDLFHSSEYTARARTDEEFVEDCYLAYLNHASDPEGFKFWLDDCVANGRDHVLAAFGDSIEFAARIGGADVPRFSDRGTTGRNVVWDNNQSTLTRQVISDADLPNRVIVTFDDSAHGNAELPLVFEDAAAQLRAGRAAGDNSRRAVEKLYSLLGVTDHGEAARLGNLLLHLGEFDEGGTENNLRISFKTHFADCLTLRKYDLIEVDSASLERYGFRYFRIRTMRRLADLQVEISAQAYNDRYYDRIESVTTPPPLFAPGGLDNPGGDLRVPPYKVALTNIAADVDRISFTIGETPIESFAVLAPQRRRAL
jgi:hypothetical protein